MVGRSAPVFRMTYILHAEVLPTGGIRELREGLPVQHFAYSLVLCGILQIKHSALRHLLANTPLAAAIVESHPGPEIASDVRRTWRRSRNRAASSRTASGSTRSVTVRS